MLVFNYFSNLNCPMKRISRHQMASSLSWSILGADVAGGWWNIAARPVLCVVRKVDYIWHPCADKLTHLSTYGYHIRSCLVWRNTTSSDLFHCSHQRTLYLEGSLIKILSCQGALLFLLVSCMKKKSVIYTPEFILWQLEHKSTPTAKAALVGKI